MDQIKFEIKEFLEANYNEAHASKMKAYLKYNFDLYGVRAPQRKVFFKSLWSNHKNEIKIIWSELTQWLWSQDMRDYHYIAMDIIGKIEKSLILKDLDIIESFIINHSWWDSVDFLASHGIGQVLKGDTELQMKVADRYMKGDNMWLQRTAIIFQLFYKEETNQDLLFAMIDETIGSTEFFINKATGWALRQYAKTNPDAVRQYVDFKRPKLSGLTLREATKYLK